MGVTLCLSRVPDFFVERAHRLIQHNPPFSGIAISAANAHADMEVLARARWIRFRRGNTTHVYSGTSLPARGLVLLPCSDSTEIAARVSTFAGNDHCNCTGD